MPQSKKNGIQTVTAPLPVGVSTREELRISDVSFANSVICKKSVQNISSTLIILDLKRCNLNNCTFLSDCRQLRYCDLSNNLINEIPQCLRRLVRLQFLDLSFNLLEFTRLSSLQHCPQGMMHLSLISNPATTNTRYRDFAVNTLLKSNAIIFSLDLYFISDEERIRSSYGEPSPMGEEMKVKYLVPLELVSVPPMFFLGGLNSQTLIRLTLNVKLLQTLFTTISPIVRVQRNVKSCLRQWKYLAFFRVLPRMQGLARKFLLMSRLNRELKHLLSLNNARTLFDPNATKVNIVKRDAMDILKAFCIRTIISFRKWKSSTRIQLWFRKLRKRMLDSERWIRDRQIGGVIVCASEKSRVERCLDYLLQLNTTSSRYGTSPNVSIALFPIVRLYHYSSMRLWGLETCKILMWNQKSHLLSDDALQPPQSPGKPGTLSRSMSLKSLSAYSGKSTKSGIVPDSPASSTRQSSKSSKFRSGKASPFAKATLRLKEKSTRSESLHRLELKTHRVYPAGLGTISSYLSNNERQIFHRIRRRGHSFFREESSVLRDVVRLDLNRFHENSKPMLYLQTDDCRLLSDLVTLLTRNAMLSPNTTMDIYFDSMAIPNVAAISIQRVVRGIICRRFFARKILKRLSVQRAVTLLQRWWRFMNGLHRRLLLIAAVCERARSITSNVLYCDAWVYYVLLRAKYLPQLPKSLRLFAEFRGAPSVNSEGRACFRHLKCDVTSSVESNDITTDSQSLTAAPPRNFNQNLLLRYGLPYWAPWRPSNQPQTDTSLKARNKAHYVVHSLLSNNVIVSIQYMEPNYAPQLKASLKECMSDTNHFGLRVVRLQFSSLAEARSRAAMIMLASYESISRKTVLLMTQKELEEKLLSKTGIIGQAHLQAYRQAGEDQGRNQIQISGSNALTRTGASANQQSLVLFSPVEMKVWLNRGPDWVKGFQHHLADVIRFRFMCEYLQFAPVVEKEQTKVQPVSLYLTDYNEDPSIRDTMEYSIVSSVESSSQIVDDDSQSVGTFEDSIFSDSVASEGDDLWVDEHEMFKKLDVLSKSGSFVDVIRSSLVKSEISAANAVVQNIRLNDIITPTLAPIIDPAALALKSRKQSKPLPVRAKSSVWTQEKLLNWCSRNEDIPEQHVPSRNRRNAEFLVPEINFGAADFVAVSQIENIQRAQYESFVKETNRKKSDQTVAEGAVLRECEIPALEVDSDGEPPPVNTARSLKSAVERILDTPLSTTRPVTSRQDVSRSTEYRDRTLPSQDRPKSSLLYQKLRQMKGSKEEEAHRNLVAAAVAANKEAKLEEIAEARERAKIAKDIHDSKLAIHDRAVSVRSTLAFMSKCVEKNMHVQLKANRAKYLRDRVQRNKSSSEVTVPELNIPAAAAAAAAAVRSPTDHGSINDSIDDTIFDAPAGAVQNRPPFESKAVELFVQPKQIALNSPSRPQRPRSSASSRPKSRQFSSSSNPSRDAAPDSVAALPIHSTPISSRRQSISVQNTPNSGRRLSISAVIALPQSDSLHLEEFPSVSLAMSQSRIIPGEKSPPKPSKDSVLRKVNRSPIPFGALHIPKAT